jgi:hypothetical protein
MNAADVREALAGRWELVDHGAFGEVTDADGVHVALVGYEPPQVEVDLSVVLAVADEDLQDAAEAADRLLRSDHLAPWVSEGFVPAPVGAIYEGESAEDPESGVLSYDLPVTSLAGDAAGVVRLLAFAEGRPRDFALWGVDGPLTALEGQ